MRIWIDLANSPHVPLFVPIVRRFRDDQHEVLLTVRDHAQTAALARAAWPDATPIGGPSPPGRFRKGRAIAARAASLRRFARTSAPDVALSHGSYAQIFAARLARVPAVTMMDYEHQPANHLSFRLAGTVLVPSVFPEDALRRFGAAAPKVVRYHGFKEQLYLDGSARSRSVLEELGLDLRRVVVVMRPPPEGALYHRPNARFDELLDFVAADEAAEIVLLPRTVEQAERYRLRSGSIVVPEGAIDGQALLAAADLTIGAGGTMNRESAVLGTPTYTVFAGRLAAVDAELMRHGRIGDLRQPGQFPRLEKKQPQPLLHGDRLALLDLVVETTLRAAGRT